MKLHIGTKLIKSEVMNRIDYTVYRGWTLPTDEDGSDEGFLVEYINGGKPNHPDHKGYISWSPKDVHDNDYQDVTKGVSFGSAVMLAKLGHKVSRIGWNGSGMFAYIVPEYKVMDGGANWHIPEGDALSKEGVFMRGHWELKTAQEDIAMWSPSGSDSLANDWVLVE